MPLYIADYLGDTQHLSTLEHGAYLLLIMQYWQKDGLPDDEVQLMRIARMSPEEWTSAAPVLQRLFKQGWKHPRIDAELALTDEKIEKKSQAGQKGGRASALARKQAKEAKLQAERRQASTDAVSTGSTSGAAKFNTSTTTKEDSVPTERTPVASSDPEKELFDRGKQVLGKSAGGVIVKLVHAKGGNVALARAAIEQASTKQSPSEYIGAVIRGGAGPPAFASRETNGFAEIANGNQQASDGYGSDHRIIDVTPNQSGGSHGPDRRKEFASR
jgi:uncharacterized protein YdaU (DUF1376 family)